MNKVKVLILVLNCLIFTPQTLAELDIDGRLTPEQLKQDFTQLYEGLKSSHVDLFANVSETDYQSQFDKVYRQLSRPLSLLQARIVFQEFVALGKIAHARIDFPEQAFQHYRDAGGLAFPIYVKISDGKWTVAESYATSTIPQGSEITHIDDEPIALWFERLQSFISADTPLITASLLEFQLPQYLWLWDQKNGQQSQSYQLRFVMDGTASVVTVDNISRQTLRARARGSEASADSATDEMRSYRVLAAGVGYLKPGPFYNAENPNDVWNNANFVAFIDDAFEYFLNNDVEQLVIDVRNNPGGTNSFSDPLIAWFADKPFKFASKFLVRSSHYAEASNQKRLESSSDDLSSDSSRLAAKYKNTPYGERFNFDISVVQPRDGKRFSGEVFVSVDRSSYSNAVSLAAIVQDYDFGEVIGETTADFATTYASMETFILDESGITVGFPKAHIIRPSGDPIAGPVYPDLSLKGHPLETLVRALGES